MRLDGAGVGRDSGGRACVALVAGTELDLAMSCVGPIIDEILVFSRAAALFCCGMLALSVWRALNVGSG